MITVKTYATSEISDNLLQFAVISAKFEGKWVFCRHKKRSTWEIPGGHRETGEDITDSARRELYEETGAKVFDLTQICVYSASDGNGIGYGMLYLADIKEFDPLPEEFEIGEISFFDDCPDNLTYPEIQGFIHKFISDWAADREEQCHKKSFSEVV